MEDYLGGTEFADFRPKKCKSISDNGISGIGSKKEYNFIIEIGTKIDIDSDVLVEDWIPEDDEHQPRITILSLSLRRTVE